MTWLSERNNGVVSVGSWADDPALAFADESLCLTTLDKRGCGVGWGRWGTRCGTRHVDMFSHHACEKTAFITPGVPNFAPSTAISRRAVPRDSGDAVDSRSDPRSHCCSPRMSAQYTWV